MIKGSNCDRKSQLSKILAELLTPRDVAMLHQTDEQCQMYRRLLLRLCGIVFAIASDSKNIINKLQKMNRRKRKKENI